MPSPERGAPRREQPTQTGVAEPLLALLVAFLLQSQGTIEHETARAREAAHALFLLTTGTRLELEGLQVFQEAKPDLEPGSAMVFSLARKAIFSRPGLLRDGPSYLFQGSLTAR